MAKIILFEDENFGGKKLELLCEVSDLSEYSFNDIISSIIVESGNWLVYGNTNFSQPEYKLSPGKYPTPESWGGKDDEIISVKPYA